MIYGVILAPSSPFIKSYNGHTFLSYFKEPEIEEKPNPQRNPKYQSVLYRATSFAMTTDFQ